MGSDFIAFDAASARDPDGAKLRDVLSAHFTLERARLHRAVLVHWLAALSVPVWLIAAWPGWLAPQACKLVLACWAVSALLAGASVVREWRWRARLESQAADISAELPRNT